MDLLCDTGRVPEAAFFARTYAPSLVAEILPKWKQELVDLDQAKIADSCVTYCHVCRCHVSARPTRAGFAFLPPRPPALPPSSPSLRCWLVPNGRYGRGQPRTPHSPPWNLHPTPCPAATGLG